MAKKMVGLLAGALLVLGGMGQAEACRVPSKIKLLWPTTTSTSIAANTRVLVLSRFNEGGDSVVRLRVSSLTSTTSAVIAVTRLNSKYLNTAHPYAGIESLWLADTDLGGFSGRVEVTAELLVGEEGRSETSTSAQLNVDGEASEPTPMRLMDNGAFFFRDGTFDLPFDTCSFVHANEGTSVYLHVQSPLPSVLTVIPMYPCESALSDPAYALSAHGAADLHFSFFSRDCGLPLLRYEMVDVLGRQIDGALSEVAGCAPTLLAARWGLEEWQTNGQPCTEELFDSGVLDSGTQDAGSDVDGGMGHDDAGEIDASHPLTEQEGCACRDVAALEDGGSLSWMMALVPIGVLLARKRRRLRRRYGGSR